MDRVVRSRLASDGQQARLGRTELPLLLTKARVARRQRSRHGTPRSRRRVGREQSASPGSGAPEIGKQGDVAVRERPHLGNDTSQAIERPRLPLLRGQPGHRRRDGLGFRQPRDRQGVEPRQRAEANSCEAIHETKGQVAVRSRALVGGNRREPIERGSLPALPLAEQARSTVTALKFPRRQSSGRGNARGRGAPRDRHRTSLRAPREADSRRPLSAHERA